MVEGLKTAIEIVKTEMELAKEINPIMAFGMKHIQIKLECKLKEVEAN